MTVSADAALVARCRTGDQEAWRELVERYSRYVHAICMRAYRLSPDDAEDVFQDVSSRPTRTCPSCAMTRRSAAGWPRRRATAASTACGGRRASSPSRTWSRAGPTRRSPSWPTRSRCATRWRS